MVLKLTNIAVSKEWTIQLTPEFNLGATNDLLTISSPNRPMTRIYRNDEDFKKYNDLSISKSPLHPLFPGRDKFSARLKFEHNYIAFSEWMTLSDDAKIKLPEYFRQMVSKQTTDKPHKLDFTMIDRRDSIEIWLTQPLEKLRQQDNSYYRYLKAVESLDNVEQTLASIEYRPKDY